MPLAKSNFILLCLELGRLATDPCDRGPVTRSAKCHALGATMRRRPECSLGGDDDDEGGAQAPPGPSS